MAAVGRSKPAIFARKFAYSSGKAVLDQVAGQPDEVGPRVEGGDALQDVGEGEIRDVAAVELGARGREVRIGNLGDEQRERASLRKALDRRVRDPEVEGNQFRNTAASGGKPLKPTEE